MAKREPAPVIARPLPPVGLGEMLVDGRFAASLAPSPELGRWAQDMILSADGLLHNPEHAHLIDGDIEFLWAASGFEKQGRLVLGQAEQVMFRAGGWQKLRQVQQMEEWFGRVPAFLITVSAAFCRECSDADFCALIEHELYHIAQDRDQYGAPAFTKEGMPRLKLRGHDVEEFVGVVRRYGASTEVQRLVDAAKGSPEVAKLNVARACGTCLLRVA
jgi:hypothetical protein